MREGRVLNFLEHFPPIAPVYISGWRRWRSQFWSIHSGSHHFTLHTARVWEVGAYRNRCQQLVQPVDGAFFRDRNGIAFHFPQDIRWRGLFTVSFRANWGNWKKNTKPTQTQVLLPSRGSGEIMINYFTRSFMGMCLSFAISSSRNGSTRLAICG